MPSQTVSLSTPLDYASLVALVTGASRGIGAEIARELARRGTPTLILTARSQSDLDSLADELRHLYQTRVEIVAADLADPAAPSAVRAATDQLGLSVDLLVNNAGFGDHGDFATRTVTKQTDMVEVNVAALVALTGLYLPGMVARATGAILNVASTAAFQPVPYMATYGATKAFVLSFSEALWAENLDRATRVRVVCLCPGGTATDFGAVATEGNPGGRGVFEQMTPASPAEVAQAGLDALDSNASFAVPGALNYVGTLGARLLPRSAMARMAASLFRPVGTVPPPTSAVQKNRRLLIAGAAFVASVAAVAVVIAKNVKTIKALSEQNPPSA